MKRFYRIAAGILSEILFAAGMLIVGLLVAIFI